MLRIVLITLVGPMLWGTTYVVFTETLPVDHPLLVGALRALPAGLLLLALNPHIPSPEVLKRHAVIGALNIGLFFGLLFVAAARMPGGLTATLGAIQPLIVILLTAWITSRKPHRGQVIAALAGAAGIALLVLSPADRPDPVGVVAALTAATSMAIATVLIGRWGRDGSPLEMTTWQLIFGGLMLLPVALFLEGIPDSVSLKEGLGYTWLVVFGTAFAYYIWTRGVRLIGPSATYLALASPLVATIIGGVLLREWFTPMQWLGVALVLGATTVGVSLHKATAPAPSA